MIFLFTDFGSDGPYVGQVMAVLARNALIVPAIEIFLICQLSIPYLLRICCPPIVSKLKQAMLFLPSLTLVWGHSAWQEGVRLCKAAGVKQLVLTHLSPRYVQGNPVTPEDLEAEARAIFADPRAVVSWGPPNTCQARAVPGGYRVTGRWGFSSGCRQATWMGAHCQVVEADGSLRQNQLGRAALRTLLFPVEQVVLHDTWNTIGLRGTASDSYSVDDLFVSEAFSGTREDPSLRRDPSQLYAFPMQGLYAVGVAGVALGTARAMLEAYMDLAGRKVPRGLKRLADSAVVQAEVARHEARLGAAEAYLQVTLREIWDGVAGAEIIAIPDRARVRLACAHAIQTSSDVADFAYKAAGTDAIVPGSAFERRFRDIHTLTQQIQARAAHFEAVGQVLLGVHEGMFY